MKKYEQPLVEVIEFSDSDAIMTSNYETIGLYDGVWGDFGSVGGLLNEN